MISRPVWLRTNKCGLEKLEDIKLICVEIRHIFIIIQFVILYLAHMTY